MGKQSMARFTTRTRFENPPITAKNHAIRDCARSRSRDNLSHILFCSIPGGRESESTTSFHETRPINLFRLLLFIFIQQTQQP